MRSFTPKPMLYGKLTNNWWWWWWWWCWYFTFLISAESHIPGQVVKQFSSTTAKN
jgi:hypothetical protein